MTDPTRTVPTSTQQTSSHKWAPWWIYLIVLLGANYLRSYFIPGSSLPLPVIAVIAIGQAALLFVIVTAIWRATRHDRM